MKLRREHQRNIGFEETSVGPARLAVGPLLAVLYTVLLRCLFTEKIRSEGSGVR